MNTVTLYNAVPLDAGNAPWRRWISEPSEALPPAESGPADRGRHHALHRPF